MAKFHEAVGRAIKIVGGQAKLAAAVGCAQSEVWRLSKTAKSISPATAIEIVKATDGRVALRDLIPDVVDAVVAELSQESPFPTPASTEKQVA